MRCCVHSQVMYFSSLFPYVVLICFLVRALLLKGSLDGIRHMFTPKVTHCAPLHAAFWTCLYKNTMQSNRNIIRPWTPQLPHTHPFDPDRATNVIFLESGRSHWPTHGQVYITHCCSCMLRNEGEKHLKKKTKN